MEHFFTTIPGIILSIGGIVAVVIVGLLYVIGLWKKGKDGDDDRLIKILSTTVDELEKKVNKQTIDIEQLTKEVQELKRDNNKYIEIFQGRDVETKEFHKRMYATIDTIAKTHDIITTMAQSIENTNAAMQKLIELIGKSYEMVGKVAGK